MVEKLLLIGLDAAEWSIVERYLDDGDMPHLAKLLSVSTRVRMQAPETYKAEGRWAEFLTGSTPRESQYWSINDFDPHSYTPWYARSAHGTYFYSRPDLKTIVFDIPNSVVAEDAHGIQIFGWGSHATQFPTASQPPSVLHRIDERFGVNEAMWSDGHHAWHSDLYLDTLQAAMEKGIRQRTEIVKWLDRQAPDWRLFVVVYGETHVAEHQYLHGVDSAHPLHGHPLAARSAERMRSIFQGVDEAVGELVRHFGPDVAVVPFAVHGMRPNAADVIGSVLIPELLHRQQFGVPHLNFPTWNEGEPFLVLDPRVLPRHHLESLLSRPTPTTRTGPRSLPTSAVRRIRHHLPPERLNAFEKRYWHRPDWWEMHLRPKTPPHKRDLLAEAARIELESVAATSWYRAYWPKMSAFVIPSFSDCHIRLNLQGRERDGRIAADDYEAALDRVEADLRQLTNPRTTNPVVVDVHRPRIEDPFAEIAPSPDLIVTFEEVTDVIEHPDVGVVGAAPLMRMGEHSRNAWALLPNGSGPRVSESVYEPRDLPATVLDLLDLRPGPTVTGRSFAEEATGRGAAGVR